MSLCTHIKQSRSDTNDPKYSTPNIPSSPALHNIEQRFTSVLGRFTVTGCLCFPDGYTLALEAELPSEVIGLENQLEAVVANIEERAPKYIG